MNFKDAKQYGFSQEELLSTKRDENGSLVLDDKIDLNELPIDAREGMGTEEREKFWFKTQDGKAYMFKSCVEGIDNYGIYSEIIAHLPSIIVTSLILGTFKSNSSTLA